MRTIISLMNASRLLQDRRGATAIEYGLIAAGIGVTIAATVGVGVSAAGVAGLLDLVRRLTLLQVDPTDFTYPTELLNTPEYFDLFFSLLGLVVNLISDLTYTWIDPRIDFETREA